MIMWERTQLSPGRWWRRWRVMVQSQIFAVVVQLLYVVQLFANPRTAAHQAPLSSTVSQSLFKFMSIEFVMLFNHLILCLSLLLLPSIFPSIRVFSNELALHIRWSKFWSFNFSISPSNQYSGLFSFRIDWFDIAVQRTLKSLLQYHNSKASTSLAFLMVQLSPPYMTNGDMTTIALIIWTFVGKVMSLLFNTLCSFFHIFASKKKNLFCFSVCSKFFFYFWCGPFLKYLFN